MGDHEILVHAIWGEIRVSLRTGGVRAFIIPSRNSTFLNKRENTQSIFSILAAWPWVEFFLCITEEGLFLCMWEVSWFTAKSNDSMYCHLQGNPYWEGVRDKRKSRVPATGTQRAVDPVEAMLVGLLGRQPSLRQDLATQLEAAAVQWWGETSREALQPLDQPRADRSRSATLLPAEQSPLWTSSAFLSVPLVDFVLCARHFGT